MPLSALPGWLQRFAREAATFIQIPPSAAVAATLGAWSTACAGRGYVLVQRGYVEPLCTWWVVVLASGERKSALLRLAADPLTRWERAQAEAMGPEIARAETERDVLEKRLTAAKQAAARTKGDDRHASTDEAQRLAEELAAFDVPVAPRRVISDCTSEQLASLLSRHEALGLISAEAGLFDMLRGRYSSSLNLDAWLCAHAGDRLRVDRVGRPSEYVEHPALAICMAAQPDVLSGLAATPALRGRGLLARFCYVAPRSMLGSRRATSPPMQESTLDEYQRRVTAMLDQQGAARCLRLTPEAESRRLAFVTEVEKELAEDGALRSMTDWGSKQTGLVVRFAGLLALARAPDTAHVEGDDVANAAHLCRALQPHAASALDLLGADVTTGQARRILRWLKRKGLRRSVPTRLLFQALKGRGSRIQLMRDLAGPIGVLVEHGYLRPMVGESGGNGGSRLPQELAKEYLVNPHVYEAGGGTGGDGGANPRRSRRQ